MCAGRRVFAYRLRRQRGPAALENGENHLDPADVLRPVGQRGHAGIHRQEGLLPHVLGHLVASRKDHVEHPIEMPGGDDLRGEQLADEPHVAHALLDVPTREEQDALFSSDSDRFRDPGQPLALGNLSAALKRDKGNASPQLQELVDVFEDAIADADDNLRVVPLQPSKHLHHALQAVGPPRCGALPDALRRELHQGRPLLRIRPGQFAEQLGHLANFFSFRLVATVFPGFPLLAAHRLRSRGRLLRQPLQQKVLHELV
eukprot:scaffold57_cov254-Pinguiococcus_pyrenoidosus.AAC.29